MKNGDVRIFLDFDGVVCDSAQECYVSSREAFADYSPQGRAAFGEPDPPERELFFQTRPFIRSGEDYLVIHDLIRRGIHVSNQREFDEALSAAGEEQLRAYEQGFDKARRRRLAEDRSGWLSLHRLYTPFDRAVRAAAGDSLTHILSTKRPEFILEILAHFGIDWPSSRVLFPDGRTKLSLIQTELRGGETCVFIDDQLDHVEIAAADTRVAGYLAGWGYVKPEWTKGASVPVLTQEAGAALISEILRCR